MDLSNRILQQLTGVSQQITASEHPQEITGVLQTNPATILELSNRILQQITVAQKQKPIVILSNRILEQITTTVPDKQPNNISFKMPSFPKLPTLSFAEPEINTIQFSTEMKGQDPMKHCYDIRTGNEVNCSLKQSPNNVDGQNSPN